MHRDTKPRPMLLYLYATNMRVLAAGHSGTCTHLRSYQGEYLGKDNVTGESKKDMIAECREPHHPLEVGHILWKKHR